MKITDKHRSMIATALVSTFNRADGVAVCRSRSLCCAPDALEACERIVGKAKAGTLRSFFYESLGCCGSADPDHHVDLEQDYLDKIAELERL